MKTQETTEPTVSIINNALAGAILLLNQSEAAFAAGRMDRADFCLALDKCLLDGLRVVAVWHGVTLMEPVQFEDGKVSLVAMPSGGMAEYAKTGVGGKFGSAFAEAVSDACVREQSLHGGMEKSVAEILDELRVTAESGACTMNMGSVRLLLHRESGRQFGRSWIIRPRDVTRRPVVEAVAV
jgi:hypothetical protein